MTDRFQRRRAALGKLLEKHDLPGLLVTSFTNVTYLTGFTGDDSHLLLTRKKEILLSDSRFETQLKEECPGLDVSIRTSGVAMAAAVEKTVKSTKVNRLGIEGDSMTVGLRERLAGQLPTVELVTTSGLVETLRVKKDREEIAAIRRAVRQAEKAFGILRASLRGDMSERLAAYELEHQMRLQGARGASFPTIVAAGPRAALPHASPTEALIESSPFVLVDWGANEGLYVSDLTRMIFTGRIPAKMQRIYEVVLQAQLAAIAAIRPGVPAREVDAVARGIIADAGFGRFFGHGLGHGIGLQVHEGPRLGAVDTPLESGMVVTVEPGIYLPGIGGVRIEDDVLVTRDGHEVLTSVPKSLESALVD